MNLDIDITIRTTKKDELILAMANAAVQISKGEYTSGRWVYIIGANGEVMPDADGYPLGYFMLTEYED